MTVLGIVFVILAAGFFLAELEMPGVGIAAAAGTLSLIFGVLFLIDDLPSLGIRLAVVIPISVVCAASVMLARRLSRRVRTAPSSTTGPAVLISELARVRTSRTGPQAFVVGAWWSIRARDPDVELRDGLRVEIVAVDGLTLVVEASNQALPRIESPEQGEHQ